MRKRLLTLLAFGISSIPLALAKEPTSATLTRSGGLNECLASPEAFSRIAGVADFYRLPLLRPFHLVRLNHNGSINLLENDRYKIKNIVEVGKKGGAFLLRSEDYRDAFGAASKGGIYTVTLTQERTVLLQPHPTMEKAKAFLVNQPGELTLMKASEALAQFEKSPINP